MIPLVLTFSTPSQTLKRKIKENFTNLQEQMENFQEYKIITAFRRNKNLKDSLVHASLKTEKREKNPYQKKVSFIFNCHTNLGAPITQNIDLESSNSVYLIECLKCKELYVGQTKNSIEKRLKQHIYYITKSNKTYLLYSHFREHGITNLRCVGLESSPTWTFPRRLAREAFWIKKLNTIDPNALNEHPQESPIMDAS